MGNPDQHEFCEACYPAIEAERTKAYNSNPSNPLPADVAAITAEELIAASRRAHRNGADKPVFKHILSEVSRLPLIQQRLAFEILDLAVRSLARGEEPEQIILALRWSNAIEPERMPEYSDWLERVITQCFELHAQDEHPSPLGHFEMPLSLALITLAKVNPHRFTDMLQVLKNRGGDEELDPRWKVITEAKQAAVGKRI